MKVLRLIVFAKMLVKMCFDYENICELDCYVHRHKRFLLNNHCAFFIYHLVEYSTYFWDISLFKNIFKFVLIVFSFIFAIHF